MKLSWSFNTQRLTTCRELLGLSTEQLAAKIGVSGQTVRNWERGKSAPNGRELATLANAFRLTPYGFFELAPSSGGQRG